MGGRPSSNCTSTTAPITATTFPFAAAAAAGDAFAPAAAAEVFSVNDQNKIKTCHKLSGKLLYQNYKTLSIVKFYDFHSEEICLRKAKIFVAYHYIKRYKIIILK